MENKKKNNTGMPLRGPISPIQREVLQYLKYSNEDKGLYLKTFLRLYELKGLTKDAFENLKERGLVFVDDDFINIDRKRTIKYLERV